MSKERWKIELIDVGRGKVCRTYKSHYDTLVEVEARALTCCKKYLASKGVFIEHHGDLVYDIYAGSRLVGHVKITSIPEKPKCQAHQKH